MKTKTAYFCEVLDHKSLKIKHSQHLKPSELHLLKGWLTDGFGFQVVVRKDELSEHRYKYLFGS